ncbi:MAG: glycosyltransferase family 2 protein [Bacillota bacterium]|nr:glycosyltransferase family 2 protein [Bacillota bacterium]
MDSVFCTVFTSTYNRAYTLPNLYNSLINQSNKNFEWLIIDDGSIDDTEELISKYIKERKINITYKKVGNGGKHRAINKGIKIANGKVFAIVDSDDQLTFDAIDKLYKWFSDLKDGKKYCGVSGNKGYSNGKIIGSTFSGNVISCSAIERNKYNIKGDKFEVYYTNILKKYPFPEFEGEKFLSEIIVWTRMAKDGYVIQWHNDIIYLCEYLNDGLTTNNYKLLRNNPKGYALRIKEQVLYANISFKQKLGYYSTYYFLNKNKKNLRIIKNELEVCNYFDLILSIILRKIMQIMKGTTDEFKE